MDDTMHIAPDDIEIVDTPEYSADISKHFGDVPNIAKPLINSARKDFKKIEQMLYSAPAFINVVKASIPEEILQAILTDEQKSQLAKGTLELMSKKDGSLMANLINPKTKKVVSTISLERIKLSPEISQAMTSYVVQMQMAQIAEQIQRVQVTIEEVRQGQEKDRLATAYSCQQKLLQATSIKNPELKIRALLRIAFDAEDSRNFLMQSQSTNVAFIQNQPESIKGKIFNNKAAKQEEIDTKINEMRDNLWAVNMVSLVEVMAYQEMGEIEAAQVSLQYYADYIQKTYLKTKRFVDRLDMLDPLPGNYWSKVLPDIEKQIQELPCNANYVLIEGDESETNESKAEEM